MTTASVSESTADRLARDDVLRRHGGRRDLLVRGADRERHEHAFHGILGRQVRARLAREVRSVGALGDAHRREVGVLVVAVALAECQRAQVRGRAGATVQTGGARETHDVALFRGRADRRGKVLEHEARRRARAVHKVQDVERRDIAKHEEHEERLDEQVFEARGASSRCSASGRGSTNRRCWGLAEFDLRRIDRLLRVRCGFKSASEDAEGSGVG